MSSDKSPIPKFTPEQEVKCAWACFGVTFTALTLRGLWLMADSAASTEVDEKDHVQGWDGIVKHLPAYSMVIVVALLGVWFATQASLHGSTRDESALIATSHVLLFAFSAVTHDAAEITMADRAPTVASVAFMIDAGIVGFILLLAHRRIRYSSRQ